MVSKILTPTLLLLAATSAFAGSPVNIQSGDNFTEKVIAVAAHSSVTVKIDRNSITVDCNGPSLGYTLNKIDDGSSIVIIHARGLGAVYCPSTEHKILTGIEFQLPNDSDSVVYETVIIPEKSVMTAEQN